MMNGQMALLRVRQMAEADRLTVAAGMPAIDMMEHAGGAVAREIGRRWKVRPVVVLCGPGNNGGDGFVAARHLVEAGWPVRIALLGPRDHLAGEARCHAERWRATVEPLSPPVLDGAELVVDAIFGAGLSRKLEGPAAETLAEAARRGPPIIAIDVPSGLMGDAGEALGAVAAVLTVTFFRKKPGHLILPGRCAARSSSPTLARLHPCLSRFAPILSRMVRHSGLRIYLGRVMAATSTPAGTL
jgi:ADP-dependent NAD(P)H-hydrate dehydratase / NAD(P)H-hydrate epimerase